MRCLLVSLLFAPLLSWSQYCEDFNSDSKTVLDSLGWDATPNNGWSVVKTGAYEGRSCFLNAGIGGSINLLSECNISNSTNETVSFQYTFNFGSGLFMVGVQSAYNPPNTGVLWLDTVENVGTWTAYSLSFTSPFNPYRIVFNLTNTSSSSKIGIDDLCFANSTEEGICVLLPVELTYFTADPVNSGELTPEIRLSWGTESELNSKSFIVLRSRNQLEFESIAEMNAAGYSSAPIEYSYTDKVSSAGQYYYRLKQLDLDGTYTFSNIVAVSVQGVQPTWSFTNGILHNISNSNVDLVIYSSTGMIVYTHSLSTGSTMDLRFLPPGIYFARDASHVVKAISIF